MLGASETLGNLKQICLLRLRKVVTSLRREAIAKVVWHAKTSRHSLVVPGAHLTRVEHTSLGLGSIMTASAQSVHAHVVDLAS
jgi:hypothetical protein